MKARRLDVLLTERGAAASRAEAQGLILAGRVLVDGLVCDKPGRKVGAGVALEVTGLARRYASRGGLKLERALDAFGIDVAGLVCVDIGASTGGFTDCLLQRGARRVYAVDVGYGLLDWRLRTDDRVVVLERTNARYLTWDSFTAAVEARGRDPLRPTFAACDVSFISLLKVVPAVVTLLDRPWRMVLLVKPQFEAGREKVGRGGVVRDPAVHVQVLERVTAGVAAAAADARPTGLVASPVRARGGNVEYLLGFAAPGPSGGGPDARQVVREAFAAERRT